MRHVTLAAVIVCATNASGSAFASFMNSLLTGFDASDATRAQNLRMKPKTANELLESEYDDGAYASFLDNLSQLVANGSSNLVVSEKFMDMVKVASDHVKLNGVAASKYQETFKKLEAMYAETTDPDEDAEEAAEERNATLEQLKADYEKPLTISSKEWLDMVVSAVNDPGFVSSLGIKGRARLAKLVGWALDAMSAKQESAPYEEILAKLQESAKDASDEGQGKKQRKTGLDTETAPISTYFPMALSMNQQLLAQFNAAETPEQYEAFMHAFYAAKGTEGSGFEMNEEMKNCHDDALAKWQKGTQTA